MTKELPMQHDVAISVFNPVITKDGSYTFFSEKFQEHYHSLTGAFEEALEKHVRPGMTSLQEKNAIPKKIRLLDFCYGLGYNAIFLHTYLKENHPEISLDIVGLELDPVIVAEGEKILSKEIAAINADPTVSLQVIIGDAKESLEKLQNSEPFHLCFFDPFSPKKCPELWTEEIFKKIFNLMANNSVLTTYSCAKQIRANMKAAGFEVKDGPCVGRYAPSTIASKNS